MFRSRAVVVTLALASTLPWAFAPASAQERRSPRKRSVPVHRPRGPDGASQDFGNVAVLVDNGLMVTGKNPFDLNGQMVRFEPAGDHLYRATSSPGAIDPVFGAPLTFGYPGATEFPGDDDTQEVAFPAGFPFFGTTYRSAWVNTDGNVTFGAPEFASDDRDKAKHVLGPPRVSAYLLDVNAFNALNPAGSGSIHAAVKTGPDRLVVTWSDVADFQEGVSSTFQITLFATGVAEVAIDHIDPAAEYGVTGIAEGNGAGPIQQVDLSAGTAALPGGSVLEAFAPFANISYPQIGREFYKTHPDKFDFLAVWTDFTPDKLLEAHGVSNQTHGIGAQLDPANGQPGPTVYDFTAAHGSAGELETIVFMNNIDYYWQDAERLVNPPIERYRATSNVIDIPENFGWPVTFDGQVTPQVRVFGTLPNDDGELTRHYPRQGSCCNWIMSPMALMAHEVQHRWGTHVRFVHPTKGVGFDSYDLLGRDIGHWSYFLNTPAVSAQFTGAPRYAGTEGNVIRDLGRPASWNGTPLSLAPGERLFQVPEDLLADGYCALDLHLMGLTRASEVGPFFYVDEPASIFTGQTLDGFNPENPLDTATTMRGWAARGGVVFKGQRVDLTVQAIQAYEAEREGRENPRGRRFWGPRGNLRIRYFSDTRRVDPAGDASITLSEGDRELGDEADAIGLDGTPVDVKTIAFVLLVRSGPPSAHGNDVALVDQFRRTWETYGNGPATDGRGRFDTRLDPPVH
jgi:hypothetical protein